LSPLAFLGVPLFSLDVFLSPLAFLGVPHFSSEVFSYLLAFLGVPLFSSEVFFESLSIFRGAYFVIRGLFLSPLVFLGVLLFSLEVFFEPVSEGSDSAPLLMALLSSAWALVDYGANLVSDFDRVHHFGGNEGFIAALGCIGSAKSKTSRPHGLPL
jgi:hypothetical protein